jgi:hypothetical protein
MTKSPNNWGQSRSTLSVKNPTKSTASEFIHRGKTAMQTTSSDVAVAHLETMTVARAFSRRQDIALAGLILFDDPDVTGKANQIRFCDDTLRVSGSKIHYVVNLIAPNGTLREGILSDNELVFFEAPGFVPLSSQEWKAGPPADKIALLRCLLASKTLHYWTGRWVEHRVAEVARDAASGSLESDLLCELEALAASEAILLPTHTRAGSPEGERVGRLTLLYMVGLADEQDTGDTISWIITAKGHEFLKNRFG